MMGRDGFLKIFRREGREENTRTEECGIVELKAVTRILEVHDAQLLSHLKLSGLKLGLRINFNVVHLKHGIRRMVNGL